MFKKRSYGKKKIYRKTKKSFKKAVINVAETRKRYEKVFDSVQVTSSLNPVVISDIPSGTGFVQRSGAKVFLKGIRIKGQFNRDAGQSAVPDYYATARVVVWFQSHYGNTGAQPVLSSLLINSEGDESDISAMLDTTTNKVKMDRRLSVDNANRQVQFFDKYIRINKTHTFTVNDTLGQEQTGKYGNWYVGIFGSGSDLLNLGYITAETMLYFKDY